MHAQLVFTKRGFGTILLAMCGLFFTLIWPGGLCARELNDPLIKAAKNGDAEILQTLISKGANVNARDECNNTVLGWAVSGDHSDCAALLLKKGADVNTKSFKGLPPLHVATYNNNSRMVKLLLANGANVNAKDPYQMTALMGAIYINSLKLVEILIESGSDVNAKNHLGQTTLFIAEDSGLTKIAQKLKASGAIASEGSLAGTIERTDQGIVLSADNGNTYIVKGKDLSEMIGQTVKVTGTLAEGLSGKTLNLTSVEPDQK